MGKPNSGRIWLYKCPVCGNNKSTFYTKNGIDYCKCTICKTKYIHKDNKIEKLEEDK